MIPIDACSLNRGSGSNPVMESIWKYNGGPNAWHFAVAFYFAFAFVAARFLLDRFVFRVSFLRYEWIILAYFWNVDLDNWICSDLLAAFQL